MATIRDVLIANDSSTLTAMLSAQRTTINRYATEEICDYICSKSTATVGYICGNNFNCFYLFHRICIRRSSAQILTTKYKRIKECDLTALNGRAVKQKFRLVKWQTRLALANSCLKINSNAVRGLILTTKFKKQGDD